MRTPKLSRLEMRIMEILWKRGPISIREVQEEFPERGRPAYTTIQTTVYRMEEKQAVRRVRKIGNAHIFEAAVERRSTQKRLIDELLSQFGGRTQPILSLLVESGKLTLEDVQEAERALLELKRKDQNK